MKLRTAGGTQDLTVRAFGAVSIFKTPQELYESAQRGVVDGALFPAEAIASYKLQEVFKYATRGANVTGFVMAYAVNGKTWRALPEDLKKIFLDVGLEQTRKFGKAADRKSRTSTRSTRRPACRWPCSPRRNRPPGYRPRPPWSSSGWTTSRSANCPASASSTSTRKP